MGIISGSIQALQDLVASSTTFAQWVGLDGSGEDPHDRVYIAGVAAEDAERPFAIVAHAGHSINDQRGAFAAGTMQVIFEADVDSTSQGTYEHALLDFTDIVEDIAEEMFENQYDSGMLIVRNIEINQPSKSDLKEDEYYQIICDVDFGAL